MSHPDSPIAFNFPSTARTTGKVLEARIDALTWNTAMLRLLSWARNRESRYVAICNAHVVVSASRDAAYGSVSRGADMATPDGAPVAWMLRRQGFAGQHRINGPDLMWSLSERCAAEGLPVYCYGSTPETLALLKQRLHAAFPDLVVTMESPPFRELTHEEDEDAVQRINRSGAGVVFVGLGCPKQERWMAEHRDRVNAVMIGVGAAFDFHAGTVARAPLWMQNGGLEWLHRLVSEPRRLAKRYLVTNTLFILGAARQLLSRTRKETQNQINLPQYPSNAGGAPCRRIHQDVTGLEVPDLGLAHRSVVDLAHVRALRTGAIGHISSRPSTNALRVAHADPQAEASVA